jgi:hypothetical protein
MRTSPNVHTTTPLTPTNLVEGVAGFIAMQSPVAEISILLEDHTMMKFYGAMAIDRGGGSNGAVVMPCMCMRCGGRERAIS